MNHPVVGGRGIISRLLFWQPKYDFLQYFLSSKFKEALLVSLNYFIWLFLFYISYLLIAQDINIFWQILIATLISELIEKKVKKKVYWCRPLFLHRHTTPPGLVARWYNTGSFPSGHTIKAVFFFLFLLINPVFPPLLYLTIVIPLLSFRVLTGFHYPIDLLGGIVIGALIWWPATFIQAPTNLNHFVKIIFDYVFFRF